MGALLPICSILCFGSGVLDIRQRDYSAARNTIGHIKFICLLMVVVPFLYVLCRANAEILFYCFAMELIFVAYYVEKVPLIETVVHDKIRKNISDLYVSRALRGWACFCFGFLCFSGVLWASNNNIRYSFVAFVLFFASCYLIVVGIPLKSIWKRKSAENWKI